MKVIEIVKYIILFAGLASSLKLEIPATLHSPPPKCVREFVSDGQLVVVNINTDGYVGDGQVLTLRIVDSEGNEYRKKRDVAGNFRAAFTSQSSSSFDICFENHLQNRQKEGQLSREIELEVEAGAAARDWNAIQAVEKLKPAEVQFRKIEEMVDEISEELQYLVRREERLRDTNESTNRRVRNFSVLIIFVLIGVGLWQVHYLRNYFRSKHIL
ncbi:hypothetical protein KL921_002315 [Ogataea angusta]|uniref:GOLD domain-containing protein n=1 Tax=Pichia angusta TaxID=870730 RepID=A0AAN6DJ96_PICAN|nr:uncharacterized protein KL928_001970 [Ogataea angusta]KAG7810687.1 hypothetical protein KL921_002315 [Ogataea angusta]KAG7819170.1 hypothetical protein KL909_004758 [Ogataea angusta]KAG7820533.1 hypothetical protein KL928_001970 [Ogataea angusta]KAG7826660.1 hypothetical protein KL920_005382 [Ogataea angusta]KAG7838770.1 hypothetical protein KL943_000846 [Ogataea angusta]